MSRLEAVARTPKLLVALDFDGTLAPIVPSPDRARVLDGMQPLLEELASIPSTTLAIVSGRDIADLRARLPEGLDAWLAGSHGRVILRPGERVAGFEPDPRLDWLRALPLLTGMHREVKEFSVAFHWRGRSEGEPLGWIQDLLRRAVAEKLEVLEGRMVLEILIPGGSKEEALDRLTGLCGASSLIYAGDDRTDLEAIRVANDRGIGIFARSGERPWSPPPGVVVVDGPEGLHRWLASFVELRRAGSDGKRGADRHAPPKESSGAGS